MTLDNFFSTYTHSTRLTLIGPLFNNQQKWEEPVIFVDGGSQFRLEKQGISVGDGDSSTIQMEVKLDTEKDFSDLAFVLQNIPKNFLDIQLLGFLGGRKDHEWFNLGEVEQFLNSRALPTKVTFDDEIVGYSSGCGQLNYQGVFSIATLQECKVRLYGDCKFHCDPAQTFRTLSSLGLSNISTGTIKFSCNKPIFIMLNR